MILEQVSEMGLPLSLYGLLRRRTHRRRRSARGRQARHTARDRSQNRRVDTRGRRCRARKAAMSRRSCDPWRHRVVGARWTEDLPKQHFFDAELAKISRGRAAAFRRRIRDAAILVARPHARVAVRRARRRCRRVLRVRHRDEEAARARQGLSATHVARTSRRPAVAIKYRARDGKQIPAYLTLPAGVEPRNLPLVLLVHGGPHARDDFTFDWWASFLASRGYAVLQANYRGSTGYGYEWFDAGRKGWGDGVMQTDVEDGADGAREGRATSTPSASASWAGLTAATRRSRARR